MTSPLPFDDPTHLETEAAGDTAIALQRRRAMDAPAGQGIHLIESDDLAAGTESDPLSGEAILYSVPAPAPAPAPAVAVVPVMDPATTVLAAALVHEHHLRAQAELRAQQDREAPVEVESVAAVGGASIIMPNIPAPKTIHQPVMTREAINKKFPYPSVTKKLTDEATKQFKSIKNQEKRVKQEKQWVANKLKNLKSKVDKQRANAFNQQGAAGGGTIVGGGKGGGGGKDNSLARMIELYRQPSARAMQLSRDTVNRENIQMDARSYEGVVRRYPKMAENMQGEQYVKYMGDVMLKLMYKQPVAMAKVLIAPSEKIVPIDMGRIGSYSSMLSSVLGSVPRYTMYGARCMVHGAYVHEAVLPGRSPIIGYTEKGGVYVNIDPAEIVGIDESRGIWSVLRRSTLATSQMVYKHISAINAFPFVQKAVMGKGPVLLGDLVYLSPSEDVLSEFGTGERLLVCMLRTNVFGVVKETLHAKGVMRFYDGKGDETGSVSPSLDFAPFYYANYASTYPLDYRRFLVGVRERSLNVAFDMKKITYDMFRLSNPWTAANKETLHNNVTMVNTGTQLMVSILVTGLMDGFDTGSADKSKKRGATSGMTILYLTSKDLVYRQDPENFRTLTGMTSIGSPVHQRLNKAALEIAVGQKPARHLPLRYNGKENVIYVDVGKIAGDVMTRLRAKDGLNIRFER